MEKTTNSFSCCKIRENEKGRLFCFPHAGAGATAYVPWGRVISAQVSLYPVLYPAREQRRNESLPKELRELARQIAVENKDVFAEKPFVFCGHCEGGIIAYETAVVLKELYGISPELLAVTGANPPDVITMELIKDGMTIQQASEVFAERGFLDSKFASNKMYVDCFVPILMKDFLMLQNYLDTDYRQLDCPIKLMYGSDDPNMNRENMSGWQKYTSADFEQKEYAGGHFFITAENIGEVLGELCRCFEK